MDLREEFVLRAKAPDANVAALCRDFGISRKTGYKWLARFDARGVEGLHDLSRRPARVVETAGEVVLRLCELRRAHPRWGPKKLHAVLARAGAPAVPAVRTIARILDRLGAPRVRRPRAPRPPVARAAPPATTAPNAQWTVDFKGWWRAANGERCEPLTVRDAASRFVLCATLLATTTRGAVQAVFVRLFRQYGLPAAIHVDNGSPFGCVRARGGLSQLSAWWIALGIDVTFSRPGKPQDNGAHERVHLDLRHDLQDTPAATRAAQQVACTRWVTHFNTERPHEALGQRRPCELYAPSPRPYRGVRAARYAPPAVARRVRSTGEIQWAGQRVFVSEALTGYRVGVTAIDAHVVRIQFYERDLGVVVVPTPPVSRRATAVAPAAVAGGAMPASSPHVGSPDRAGLP